MTFPWLKGHGTENDFVLLPDHDGSLHGRLDADFVASLCDRRRGIGADGVMRVIRTEAVSADEAMGQGAEWFMDYRNSDGSISEMCGNGVRVFALHLVTEGLVDVDQPIRIGTRDGIKTVTFADGVFQVDMGMADIGDVSKIEIDDHIWEAQRIETGNPHAVVFVGDLDDAGSLVEEPRYDHQLYRDGVNVEFVVRRGDHHVAIRIHERGSGETRSCGTGACAAAVAQAMSDGSVRPATYRVDVPGGTLSVTWTEDNHMFLSGPAEIVARGEMEWLL